MTTMTRPEPTKKPRLRSRKPAIDMPTPPDERGDIGISGGAFDDRAHYVPMGHRLRLFRTRAGVDQRQLATLTEQIARREIAAARAEGRDPLWTKGLSSYSINRYESGFHAPIPSNAGLLAAALTAQMQTVEPGALVTADMLRVRDLPGLRQFLTGVKGDRPGLDFWDRLGMTEERAEKLLSGKAKWTADELGGIAVAFPDAADLVRDVLIGQARKRQGLPAYHKTAKHLGG